MFKKKIMMLALVLLVLCTISSVSAVENGDNITFISDDAIQLNLDDGTFSDLADEIADADYELNLTRDYTYCDYDEYYINGVTIYKNITINGNGFTINGNNQARAFEIAFANVTLNNINFVNCYNEGDGGAVLMFGSDVNMDDVTFTNNRAAFGGAIYAAGNLSINNSVFRDAAGDYATAIFFEKYNLIINNTRFENLNAGISAGAVGIKLFENLIIENCNFINTTSAKNGGALLIDSGESNNKSFIRNVSFMNTFGDFGGAFIQYGGILDMQDSTFINSTSQYDGGAVYLANVSATIDNSEFISNKVTLYEDYQTYGGAIYCDFGFLRLTDSMFKDNSANNGSAVIGIYDSTYEIINSTFDNDGEAVYAVFKGKNSEIVNCSGEDTVSDENVFYPYVVSGAGRNITLIDGRIDFDTLPSSFDLRDYNLTGPIVDQGMMGSCWAFSAIGTLESALLRFAGLNTSLSVNNLQNTMIKYSKYGINSMDEAGYNALAMAYLSSWLGAIPQEYDTYDELGKISSLSLTSNNIHVHDFMIIPRDVETPGDPNMKQAILKYGELYACINSIANEGNETGYYNEKTACQYVNKPLGPNHSVIIVGWDDDISRKNFLTTPPGDGAWIVKNSWGTSFGDEGYFYVSYYDETLCPSINNEIYQCAIAILLNNTINYNRNYQYDFAGLNQFDNDSDSVIYATKFVSLDDDYIAAVGTYFNQSGVNYTVKLEVNGEVVHVQNGVSLYYGYQTIKLNEFIPIKEGDNFTAYVTSNRFPFSAFARIVCPEGVSLLYENGTWYDTYSNWNIIACLKVYTVDEIGPSKQDTNLAASYDNSNRLLTVTLTNEQTGKSLKGANVVVNVDGDKYTLKTNSTGQASLSFADCDYGTYTALISYKGNNKLNPSSITFNIVVKKDKVNLSAVYESGAKQLVVGLYNEVTGSPVKGANVVVNINGDKNNVKINSKGEGRLSLADLDYGTYPTTLTYKGNSNYDSSTVTLDVIVKDAVNLSSDYDTDADELVFGLFDNATGSPLKGANVVVSINGENYNVKINSKGEGRLSISGLDYGTYLVTATYKGNSKYASSSVDLKVVVKDEATLSAVYDSDSDEFVITLVDSVTGAPLKGANVIVNLNGKNYTVKINSKGEGRLALPVLDYGTYIATFSYKGNSKYNPSTFNLDVVVKDEANISVSYNPNSKELTVTLIDAATGTALKGANVVVTVAGESHNVKITSTGQGKLSLADLTPGTYTATALYKGNAKYHSNKVSVRVRIG